MYSILVSNKVCSWMVGSKRSFFVVVLSRQGQHAEEVRSHLMTDLSPQAVPRFRERE